MVQTESRHAGQDVILQNDSQAVKPGRLLFIDMVMSIKTDIGLRIKKSTSPSSCIQAAEQPHRIELPSITGLSAQSSWMVCR
jgi:hypothetical protein